MSEHTPEHRADVPEEDPVVGSAPPKADVLLSNNVYDKLKPVVQVWLPAMAVFYIAVAPLWGLPKQEEVAGTIMALTLLLGTILGISHRQYVNSDARFDGGILISQAGEDEHGQLVSDVNVSLDPNALATKDEIVVKVNRDR